jgi:hypothetical protein
VRPPPSAFRTLLERPDKLRRPPNKIRPKPYQARCPLRILERPRASPLRKTPPPKLPRRLARRQPRQRPVVPYQPPVREVRRLSGSVKATVEPTICPSAPTNRPKTSVSRRQRATPFGKEDLSTNKSNVAFDRTAMGSVASPHAGHPPAEDKIVDRKDCFLIDRQIAIVVQIVRQDCNPRTLRPKGMWQVYVLFVPEAVRFRTGVLYSGSHVPGAVAGERCRGLPPRLVHPGRASRLPARRPRQHTA